MIEKQSRVLYVDAAKMLSVSLVVYWHLVGANSPINEPLQYLRMPLFFFVSGFFAQRSMQLDLRSFLDRRFLPLLYLFVIWSVLHHFFLKVIVQTWFGHSASIWEFLTIFWDQPRTLWFIYDLAGAYLMGYCLWRLPTWANLPLAALIYLTPAILDIATTHPEITRFLTLTPFFLIAVRFSGFFRDLIENRTGLCLAALGAYFPIVVMIGNYRNDYNSLFLVSMARFSGILGILALLFLAQNTRVVRFLAQYGTMTIFVFVLHRFWITYLDLIAGLPRTDPVLGAVAAAVISAASLTVGIYIIRPFLPFLEIAPWRSDRRTTEVSV